MSYQRIGELEIDQNSKDIFIRDEVGKLFSVTPIVAFVWELLDGKNTLIEIENKIQSQVGDLYKDENTEVSRKIVNELLKVKLVKELH
jgi:hypothetical protein